MFQLPTGKENPSHFSILKILLHKKNIPWGSKSKQRYMILTCTVIDQYISNYSNH